MASPRNSETPLKIVLGGGLGSGKSTLSRMLESKGALRIDADALGHEVLAAEAVPAVAVRWPSTVVGGSVDRRRLAEIVFRDRIELRRLEEITHPAIAARISAIVDAAASSVVVVEVPILGDIVGSGWVRVFVDSPDDLRLERATQRGTDPADAARRMESQPSRAAWTEWADHVVSNSGGLDDLEATADRLWMVLLADGRRGG